MLSVRSLSPLINGFRRSISTHEVFNQGKLLVNFNQFDSDPALCSWVSKHMKISNNDLQMLKDRGKVCGSEAHIKHCLAAEKNPPVLRQFDQYGRRIDVVDFHQSYHEIMSQGNPTIKLNYY
jgi:putative acyl-CoA dehydrogenase